MQHSSSYGDRRHNDGENSHATLSQQVADLREEVETLAAALRAKDMHIAALISKSGPALAKVHLIDPNADRFIPPWDADD